MSSIRIRFFFFGGSTSYNTLTVYLGGHLLSFRVAPEAVMTIATEMYKVQIELCGLGPFPISELKKTTQRK
jgi:hypothetical protein